MKINRTINGKSVDIELTPAELFKAYVEHQHLLDIEDVVSTFYSLGFNPENLSEDEIGEIASIHRENLNNGANFCSIEDTVLDYLKECSEDVLNHYAGTY
jgi:hypothetical protein